MGFLKNVGKAVDPKIASTVAVHLSLICGVIAYTIFGALMMQFLESPSSVSSRLKRDNDNDEERRTTQVFLGTEVSDMDGGVHACLRHVALRIFNETLCKPHDLEYLNINNIDSCYQYAKFQGIQATSAYAIDPTEFVEPTLSPEELIAQEIIDEMNKWSFGNALIFAFTVITTIGYGHVAPVTFYGRLFCIIYGVFGVPLTLLTIADMGMFFTHVLRKLLNIGRWFIQKISKCMEKNKSNTEKVHKDLSTARELTIETENNLDICSDEAEDANEEEHEEEQNENQERKADESIALAVAFALYLLMGAKVLSVYEPEMDFFKAFYFNFVTLTTIGLGDFVPKSFDYLFITLVYIGIGLSLTTMAIEIAADLLKKVHYAGRKMENMANAVVWFGGKKMTMKNLVKYLGDQFNIDEAELANLNLDQFVDNAIKVEAGEIKSLRKPADPVVFRQNRPVSYSQLRKSSESASLNYVDDRQSKTAVELAVIPEDTFRSLDMLRLAEIASLHSNSLIPRLDLDHQFLTDSSIPNSFDDEYLRTFSATKPR